MILSLTMGDNGTLTWWVDASYAVHDDMHIHTGGTVSAGTRSVYSTSNKQTYCQGALQRPD